MIVVENIEKSYGSVEVLKKINFQVKKGEFVGIVGRSGAGKSTLMHIIGSLEIPDNGRVLIDGQDIFLLPKKQLSVFRNKEIGFVFQFHHLLPEFTAIENVMIPGLIARPNDKEAVENDARELMTYLQIDHRMSHKPSQLSGGEQQRIAVARAMINKPSILLADEPTGNLDDTLGKELHSLLLNMRDDYNQTILIVTHDQELAKNCDRTIRLVNGKIEIEYVD